MKRSWWKESVIYQIYPRSFQDTNGDGVGDFQGIIQRIPYLKQLGINVVWLCPCYASPNDDNGYDISDYRAVMPEFGTMEDFEMLLQKLHESGIKLVMDLVVNHTSDEHIWFQESLKSKDNPYRDYYIWREPKDGKEPNNWGSHFTPSAWELDAATGEYYLHLFSKKQPDLNWENPKVREEVYDLMRFWLDKGVDGFRMDVINGIKKPAGLPDSPLPPSCAEGYSFDGRLYMNNPGITEFLAEMKREVLSRYDCITVGETSWVTPEMALQYVGEPDGALDMVFHFEVVEHKCDFAWGKFKEIQREWAQKLWGKGWNSQYLQNHDQPRAVSIYGDDGVYRAASAKMLATLLHTLPGTPYVYQGEELGMTNTPFPDINAFQDINAKFDYHVMTEKGSSPQEALAYLNCFSREHSRTPMQWDAGENSGFTTGKPWLMLNPNYLQINAAAQEKDSDSVLCYYRALIALRKTELSMVYGQWTEYFPEREDVMVYTRSLPDSTILVAANLTAKKVEIENPTMEKGTLLLGNYGENTIGTTISLRPYEAVIVRQETASRRDS